MRISETGGSPEGEEHQKVIDQGSHFEKAIASEERITGFRVPKEGGLRLPPSERPRPVGGPSKLNEHLGSILAAWETRYPGVPIANLLEMLKEHSPNKELRTEPSLHEILIRALERASLVEAKIDEAQITRQGKEAITQISELVQSGTWLPADARELEAFTRGVVLASVTIVGQQEIGRVAAEFLHDPSSRDALHQIAASALGRAELAKVAEEVTDKITSAGDPNRSTLFWIVLGAAALLAIGAGVIVPILAGSAIAEVVLTNEVAIAAMAFGAAALMRSDSSHLPSHRRSQSGYLLRSQPRRRPETGVQQRSPGRNRGTSS
jgi:hypothetical protein